jgi:hypothetical protein
MVGAEEAETPVKAQAVLIDSASMTVIWANEAASQALTGSSDVSVSGITFEQLAALAGVSGVEEAARSVAETGVSRHLRADLVSMAAGRVAVVTSIYRVADGAVLMLTEHAWHVGRAKADGTGSSRSRGRAR